VARPAFRLVLRLGPWLGFDGLGDFPLLSSPFFLVPTIIIYTLKNLIFFPQVVGPNTIFSSLSACLWGKFLVTWTLLLFFLLTLFMILSDLLFIILLIISLPIVAPLLVVQLINPFSLSYFPLVILAIISVIFNRPLFVILPIISVIFSGFFLVILIVDSFIFSSFFLILEAISSVTCSSLVFVLPLPVS
jgi:hypothetical protein